MTNPRTLIPWIIALLCASPAHSATPPTQALNGELREIDGARVLRVWGTPRERGYAHGYLLAEEIVTLLNGYLDETKLGADAATYESRSRDMVQRMRFHPRYQAEARGLLAGMRARIGDKARLRLLDRPLEYEDMLAVTCIPEMARFGCSSFAAWGPLTIDGDTLAGRNLDWFRMKSLRGSQLILASIPTPTGDEPVHATVSITWPGFLGGLTMMNEDGVAISMHDVYTSPPKAPFGFTPRALALRECVESSNAGTAADDVLRLLTIRIACMGNNFMVVSPFIKSDSPPAVVMEYDGDIMHHRGVTARVPGPSDGSAHTSYQACTNHYRSRSSSGSCDRFEKLDSALNNAEESGRKLAVSDAWELLRKVACTDYQPIETYHSVVFEPNKKRMHVAFSADKKAAPFAPAVTLDIQTLLEPPGAIANGATDNP